MSCTSILPSVMGLIGVGIGACIAPWVESRKRLSARKEMLNYFYLELDDLRIESERSISTICETYRKAVLAKNGKMSLQEADEYSLPPKIEFFIIDKVSTDIFSLLTRDQRKAIRALNGIAKDMNDKVDIMISNGKKSIKDQDEFIFKAAGYSICSFKYVAERLSNEKERFVYFPISNDEIVNKVLAAYGKTLEPEEILIHA